MIKELVRKAGRKFGIRTSTAQERYLSDQARNGLFCFIHINKCGGTSVEKALGLPKIHDTAQQRHQLLGPKRWNEMFSFALIRHPYAKVASHYRYRVKTNQTGLNDRHLNLNDWVLAAYGDKDERYYDNPLMFAPCFDWISDEDGNIIVDHISKLENIENDWPFIAQSCGYEGSLPKANSTRPNDDRVEALDARSKAIILDHFQTDFENWGYDPES